MTPSTVMLAITGAAKAAEEWAKFLQTPAGQKLVEKQLDDMEKLAAFFRDLGGKLDAFGDVLKKIGDGQ